MKRIIIFYKYVTVPQPDQEKNDMLAYAKSLGLKGRIILAHEGINGTVAGMNEAITSFMNYLNSHTLFFGMDIKETSVDASYEYFPRMSIKVKSEIVNLGIDANKLTPEQGGKHLSPVEVHKLLDDNNQNLVVLDTRNNYEWSVGRFRNSVLPDIEHFRDLPDYIDKNIEQFKDKEVLMYCTAGVRCERASAYLKVKNVAKEVYQITGGIQRYVEQFPEGHFRGKNYVFDNRITVPVNDDVLGSCSLCNVPYDDFINCMNSLCNQHFIACEPCLVEFENACSADCRQLLRDNKVPARPLVEHIRQQRRNKDQ